MNECRFEGCTRPVHVKKCGLCRGHYQQQWAGKELTPLLTRHRFTAPAGYKVCTACLKVKTVDEFYLRPENNKPRSRCKDCLIAEHSEDQRNRLERVKALEAELEALRGL